MGRMATRVAGARIEPPTENVVWYLKRSRLFRNVGDDLIDECGRFFVQQTYPKRSVLFDQGDTARMVYLVKKGKVRISRVLEDGKTVTVALLGAGDLFGEEVMFAQVERRTIATCIEDSLLCLSRAEDLFGMLQRHPVIAINVANYLAEQRDDAQAAFEDVSHLKVSERLLRLFERLAEDHGIVRPEGTLIDVRLTQNDLASLVGSTRETVSLELTNLQRAGRIANVGRHFLLPKSEGRNSLNAPGQSSSGRGRAPSKPRMR
jgi:CRP/FNR family cyclic AMP-dependent transcriptional regulator